MATLTNDIRNQNIQIIIIALIGIYQLNYQIFNDLVLLWTEKLLQWIALVIELLRQTLHIISQKQKLNKDISILSQKSLT